MTAVCHCTISRHTPTHLTGLPVIQAKGVMAAEMERRKKKKRGAESRGESQMILIKT